MPIVHVDQLANKVRHLMQEENMSEAEAMQKALEDDNLHEADNREEIEKAVTARINRNTEEEQKQAEQELEQQRNEGFQVVKEDQPTETTTDTTTADTTEPDNQY